MSLLNYLLFIINEYLPVIGLLLSTIAMINANIPITNSLTEITASQWYVILALLISGWGYLTYRLPLIIVNDDYLSLFFLGSQMIMITGTITINYFIHYSYDMISLILTILLTDLIGVIIIQLSLRYSSRMRKTWSLLRDHPLPVVTYPVYESLDY